MAQPSLTTNRSTSAHGTPQRLDTDAQRPVTARHTTTARPRGAPTCDAVCCCKLERVGSDDCCKSCSNDRCLDVICPLPLHDEHACGRDGGHYLDDVVGGVFLFGDGVGAHRSRAQTLRDVHVRQRTSAALHRLRAEGVRRLDAGDATVYERPRSACVGRLDPV